MTRTNKTAPHLPRCDAARTSITGNSTDPTTVRTPMRTPVSVLAPWFFYALTVACSAAATKHIGPMCLMVETASASLVVACGLLVRQAVRDA